ncbi:MAG: TetR/AcrR family transcriptional regulator C-terminal domain-containing protein [Actinomycetota bacterium]|nr:TetR/AcrR family transcriptional regulator C-terminal domain-containing protein [Actinomycetota bacterium]
MARRARFTIDEIRTQALEIVDHEGLDALTMRRLATALGTGPMTIYNYVDDRQGLEALVVDAVAALVEVPEPTGAWTDDVRAVARAMWEQVRRHPGAIPLILTRRTSTASSLDAAEALLDALRRGGFDGPLLLAAFRTVLGIVMGMAQAELAGPLAASAPNGGRGEAERIELLAGEDRPNLAALARIGSTSRPEDDFDAGLEFVLRGLRAFAPGPGDTRPLDRS